MDVRLQPLVQRLPSYFKVSEEFIKLIRNTTIPTDSITVSIGVSSLYTKYSAQRGCHKRPQTRYRPRSSQTPSKTTGDAKHCTRKQCHWVQRRILPPTTPKWPQHMPWAPLLQNLDTNQIEMIHRWHIRHLDGYTWKCRRIYDQTKYGPPNNQIYSWKGPQFHQTGRLDVRTHIKPTIIHL